MSGLNYARDKQRRQMADATREANFSSAVRSAVDMRKTQQATYLAIAEKYETRNAFARSIVDQCVQGRPISPAQARVLLAIDQEAGGKRTGDAATPKVTQLPTAGRPRRSRRGKRQRKPIQSTIKFRARAEFADSGASPEGSGECDAPAGTEALVRCAPEAATLHGDESQDATIGVVSQVIASAAPVPVQTGSGQGERFYFATAAERDAFIEARCPAHRRLPS